MGWTLAKLCVSIHAPVKGATYDKPMAALELVGFNPRAREGRDTSVRKQTCQTLSFNPRAREGRDVTFDQAKSYCTAFQSTRP